MDTHFKFNVDATLSAGLLGVGVSAAVVVGAAGAGGAAGALEGVAAGTAGVAARALTSR